MKKKYFLISFFIFTITFLSSNKLSAQFGCGSGVIITNGYTQLGITTPGNSGPEDWNTDPTSTSINSSYWADDVYLFEYTAGGTTEQISMTIFTRNSWNGIGIFDDCTGTTFSNELDAVGTTSSNVSQTVTATISAGNTVYIAVGQWGSPNDLDFDVTNFSVIPITCPAPTTLTATNITSTAADLGWTETGSASQWQIEWGTTGFTQGSGNLSMASNPQNINSLNSNTNYEFYVRAICGAGDTSLWAGPYSFTTPCAVYTPDYTEGFNSFVPNCWDEADNGTSITGPSNLGSSSWEAGTAIGNTAKINLYTTTNSEWILSPIFNLSSGGYELLIDVAVTDWNGSTPDVMGSDDSVRVYYTEDGITWNPLLTWTVNDNLTNSLTTFTTPISSTGANVQFGILATDGPVDDSQDYDFHVDNFIVQTPPSCSAPSGLTAIMVNANDATIGWTENGTANLWEVQWGPAGFGIGSGTIDTTSNNPYMINPLAPETAWDFYVRAICGAGDSSTWVGPLTFMTPCLSSAITSFPWTENFDGEITPNMPCGWFVDNVNGDSYTWETNTYSSASSPNAMRIRWNASAAMDDWAFTPEFNFVAGQNYKFIFSHEVDGSSFPEKLRVMIGSSQNEGSMSTELFVDSNMTNTTFVTDSIPFTVPTSGSYYIGFHGFSDANMFGIEIDDVMVIEDLATSIQLAQHNNNVTIYPNPTNGIFTIEGISNAQINVVNIQGKSVYQNKILNNKHIIDLSNQAKGLYFITVTTNQGTDSFKLVIQ